MKGLKIAIAGLALSLSMPAMMQAQSTADFKTVPVSFTGTVIYDPVQPIRIEIPGALTTSGLPVTVPYVGPAASSQLQTGDKLQFSFNVTVPTNDFLSSAAYTGPVSSDGVYRLSLVGQVPGRDSTIALPGTYAQYGQGSVTGPYIEPGAGAEEPAIAGLAVVYDAGQGTYSLKFPADDPSGVVPEPKDLPGFQIGTDTPEATGPVQTVVATVAPVLGLADPVPVVLPPQPAGGTQMQRPQSIDPTPPVQVPEPGMLVLFGAAAAALFLRRGRIAAA